MSNSSSFYSNKFIIELNNKINKINLSIGKKNFLLYKNTENTENTEKNRSFSVDSSLFSRTYVMENTENNRSFSRNSSLFSRELSSKENINLYIFILLYKILHKYSTYNNISLKNISDFEFYKYCRFNNIYKIYNSIINLFNDEFNKENSTNKYIILYLNNMFESIIIKNNLKK